MSAIAEWSHPGSSLIASHHLAGLLDKIVELLPAFGVEHLLPVDRGETPDNRELEKRIDLLTKDFEVMQANLDATLNALQASAAERDAR